MSDKAVKLHKLSNFGITYKVDTDKPLFNMGELFLSITTQKGTFP